MENFEEQIKDPNQLDMFAGILLTPEQEQMVTEHIKKTKETIESRSKVIERTEQLLINSGFIKDVDFVNDFKIETITNNLELGSSWRGNNFTTEVTYLNTTGNIRLKGTRFYNGVLKESTFSIDVHADKINCYSIQGSSRFIKPETLLEKLKHHNEKERHVFQEFQKKTDVKQYTVEKYKEKYPNATVTLETEWTKHSGTFDIMKIEFTSGSWVKFRLFSKRDTESIYSKYDNEFAKLNTEEILNKFNNQEVSN
jgi:ribosomal protein S8